MSDFISGINSILQYRQQRDMQKVNQSLQYLELAQREKIARRELKQKDRQLGIEEDKLKVTKTSAEATLTSAEAAKIRAEADREQEKRLKQKQDREDFLESIESLESINEGNKKDLYQASIVEMGFVEAANLAKKDGVKLEEITTSIKNVLTDTHGMKKGKDRNRLSAKFANVIFAGEVSKQYEPTLDLFYDYNESVSKVQKGDNLSSGEKELYRSLTQLQNNATIYEIGKQSRKFYEIENKIKQEKLEGDLEKDYVIAKDVLRWEPPKPPKQVDAFPGYQEWIKQDKKTRELWLDENLENIAYKNVSDFEGADSLRNELSQAIQNKYNFEKILNEAERTPLEDRTEDQTRLIENKDDFIQELNIQVQSQNEALKLMEKEIEANTKKSGYGGFGPLWMIP